MKLICWLVGLWRSWGETVEISGHDFEQWFTFEDGTVRREYYDCMRCGEPLIIESSVNDDDKTPTQV